MSENNVFTNQAEDSSPHHEDRVNNTNPMIYRSSEQQEIIKSRKKKRFQKELLNLVIVLVIVALLIFGILYAVRIAAGYDSIKSLLDVLFNELIYIWQRIVS